MSLKIKRLLVWLGLVEATPRGPSLPRWLYLALGVAGLVVGAALIAAGQIVIGVFILVMALVNFWLARVVAR